MTDREIPTPAQLTLAAQILEAYHDDGTPTMGKTPESVEAARIVAPMLRELAPIVGQFGPLLASQDSMQTFRDLLP